MNRKKIYVITAIVAIAVWISYWQISTKRQETEKKKTTGAVKEGSTGELEQKVLSFTIDGRSPKGARQWHLEGKSADIIGEDIYLNELTAVAYGDDAKVDLTSDKGVYRKSAGEVDLIGNVEVISDNGFELTTEKATWSQETKEISTDAVVHIKAEGISAVGKGGMANSDTKVAELKEHVMVVMEPDTKVHCDGPLNVDYNNNIAIFHNNVYVEDQDGKLFADKLTVEFDPDTQKLSKVTAEGNAKLKRGKSYTMSETIIYTESTKSAELLGRPRVIIDPGELSDLEKRER